MHVFFKKVKGASKAQTHKENMRDLNAFKAIRLVCKEYREHVDKIMEYHALRLANYDAHFVGIYVFFRGSLMWNKYKKNL